MTEPSGPPTGASSEPAVELPPALAERMARRRAEDTPSAAASPSGAASAPTPGTATRRSGRSGPPAGRASRLVMAGGAIGLGFGLVGVMAAASHQTSAPQAVVQRVVVPQTSAPQPAQVIVMLPQTAGGPVTTVELPVSQSGNVISIPDRAADPAPVASAPKPVAKSHGS